MSKRTIKTPLGSLQAAIARSFEVTQSSDFLSAELFFQLLKKELANVHGPVSASDIFDVEKGWFEGSYKLWMYEDKCCVGIKNLTYLRDFPTASGLSNSISIDFVLSGGSDLNHCGRSLSNNHMPRVYVSSYHENTLLSRFHKKGESTRGVGLWVPFDLFFKEYGVDVKNLPKNVKSVFLNSSPSTITLPLTPSIRTIVTDIVDMPYDGEFATKFLYAKITELLCHTALCLNQPQALFSLNNTLSQRKSKAMAKILAYINQNISRPIRLDSLAEYIGMSPTALANMFKASYGMTVSEYVQHTRLTNAQELIKRGKLTILEASLAVGYESQSSFGRAYKNFFNHSPKNDLPR